MNPADPDTRLLPAKNGGGWLQGWNLQLGATRRQVLLAVELHDSPADAEALVPVIRAAMASLAEAARQPRAAQGLRDLVRAWLADNGYASAANFAELEEHLLLVAVTSEGAQAGRRDSSSETPEPGSRCQSRLAAPAGKALYKRRAACVEPAFAQYFARFGRYFSYRGRNAVDAEARLLATVHNLRQALRLPRPRRTQGPAGRQDASRPRASLTASPHGNRTTLTAVPAPPGRPSACPQPARIPSLSPPPPDPVPLPGITRNTKPPAKPRNGHQPGRPDSCVTASRVSPNAHFGTPGTRSASATGEADGAVGDVAAHKPVEQVDEGVRRDIMPSAYP